MTDELAARVFAIDDGSAGSFLTVQISGLKLTGGDVSGAGGAILNRENLTLTAVEIGANATVDRATLGETRIGRGSIQGGVHFGMAAEARACTYRSTT
ncbi:MAG: hypothetical protein HC793_03045 [Aquincola sp.]|nr:hypothetical protein [Aquincola sp.]